MKQKNMILVAVAVGCGLVAAFLTSKMSATPAVEQIAIPVAAKELPVGTKLSKDELKKMVAYKKVNKDSAPQVYVATEAELTDKRLVRTIRAGESFNPADLTMNTAINPPPGMGMVTIAADVTQAVAGFAGPGSHVDIIASVKLKTKKADAVVFPLLTDMLVLAINGTSQLPAKDQAFQNLSNVSFAVTNNQAMLLHAAVNRGANLRLLLRHPDKPAVWDKLPTESEIWAILSEQGPRGTGGATEEEEPTETVETVKLPVPVEDLPAGTELTADVIEKKFKFMDWTPPAPANVTQNLKEHTGKFLTDKLAANQFVPLSFLGNKPTEVAPPPAVAVVPKPEVKPEVKPGVPPVYFDTTVQTSNGHKKYRYQVLKSGEYRFLGEVREDGTLKPIQELGNAPAPAAGPSTPKADETEKPAAERVF